MAVPRYIMPPLWATPMLRLLFLNSERIPIGKIGRVERKIMNLTICSRSIDIQEMEKILIWWILSEQIWYYVIERLLKYTFDSQKTRCIICIDLVLTIISKQ